MHKGPDFLNLTCLLVEITACCPLPFNLFILCKSGFGFLTFLFFFFILFFSGDTAFEGQLSWDALSAVCAGQARISQALSHVKEV